MSFSLQSIRTGFANFAKSLGLESTPEKRAFAKASLVGSSSNPHGAAALHSLKHPFAADAVEPPKAPKVGLTLANDIDDSNTGKSSSAIAELVATIVAREAAAGVSKIEISVPKDVADRFAAGAGFFLFKGAVKFGSQVLGAEVSAVQVAPKGSRAVVIVHANV